jgi:hypothetical protein
MGHGFGLFSYGFLKFLRSLEKDERRVARGIVLILFTYPNGL